MKEMFGKSLLKSFLNAGRGLVHVFKTEKNFRIQCLAGVLVLLLAFYFPLKIWEIILCVLLITLVLTMELLNTAMEYFSDLLKPRLHHYVASVKDIMAAAVLISSLGALIAGLIIFIPYFQELF